MAAQNPATDALDYEDRTPSVGAAIARALAWLVLELAIGGVLLLAAPVYWYCVLPESFRAGWYPLIDTARGNDVPAVWQIETTRWAILAYYGFVVWRGTVRSSQCLPLAVGTFYSWCMRESFDSGSDGTNRRASPKQPLLAGRQPQIAATALRHTAHLFTVNWPYVSWFAGLSGHFALIHHLFPYDHTLRPWQFFLERSAFLALIIAFLVVVEKTVLAGVESEFQKQLFQDRVLRALYGDWAFRVLADFVRHCQQLQGTAIKHDGLMTSTKLAWTRKAFPFHSADPLLAAVLLRSSLPDGSSSAAVGSNRTLAARIASFFKRPFFEADLGTIFTSQHSKQVAAWLCGSVDLERVATSGSIPPEPRKTEDIDPNDTVHSLSDTLYTIPTTSTSTSPSQPITGSTLSAAFVQLHQERRDLIQGLSTHASLIKKLDRVMLGFVVSIVVYFLLFPIYGYDTHAMLALPIGVSIAPMVVAFTMSFGESIKSICAAIIYIVTCHPYDVGDRVTIDGTDFYVHRIGLISTVFRRYDQYMVWIPNYVMAQKVLANIRRAGHQSQRLEIRLSADSTSLTSLNQLSDRVRQFIRREQRDFDAVTSSFVELNHATNQFLLVFLLRHKFNFQDGVQRAERTNHFLFFVKQQLEDLAISYQPPSLQVLLQRDSPLAGIDLGAQSEKPPK